MDVITILFQFVPLQAAKGGDYLPDLKKTPQELISLTNGYL
ncbi:hypothetical protein [Vibrio fortis]|nr:hypothetical protein [Vibrio fortis]